MAGFASRLAREASDLPASSDASARPPGASPALSLAILTCMDARLDISGRLGISTGDAHILRNAGGRVTADVIRSLHLSVKLMNVREIGVVHHTNCGLAGTDNATLARRTGVNDIDFLPFQSLRESLRADVTAILQAEILPDGGLVWGGVYSLDTGRIRLASGPVCVTGPRRQGSDHRT